MKKAALALACLFAAACLCSCKGGDLDRGTNEKIDPSRTQLFVGNYNGGYGGEWLKSAKNKFEALYADVSYETDKTGVQIMIDNDKAKYDGKSLVGTISGSSQDMFFTESVYYYDFVSKGGLLDITDEVTKPLTEFGDDKTVLSKLTEQQKNYYCVDGRYFGIPHYEAYEGLIYDVDLFESENLYFAADPNNGNGGFVKNASERRGLGPDNKTGTIDGLDYSLDDGLPATYDDFFRLCGRMLTQGIKPLIWTGASHSTYLNWILASLAADYEGAKDMMLNYSFEGTARHRVESVGEDGSVRLKPEAEIRNANGYEVYASAGRYYALSFLERVIENTDYYHGLSFNGTQTHLLAQSDYLYSKFESISDPVAMMFEGIWWENEASETFATMESTYGESASRKARRFGYMPWPKATAAELGEKPTLLDTHYSCSFINARIPAFKIPLAKAFLRFCNTDESLADFTAITNAPKALNYEMPADKTERMTHFGKSVWNLRRAADRVYPYSKNELYLKNQSAFVTETTFVANIDNVIYNSASTALKHKGITAKQFFEGIGNNNRAEIWQNAYSKYF